MPEELKNAGLIAKYAFFALIAAGVNLALQWATTTVYRGGLRHAVALLLGTGSGLLVKYLLDKRFIFHFRTLGGRHELRTLLFYGMTGMLTTGVFWATELGFLYGFRTTWAKYIGGALGLTLGYCLKYYLDKNLVFIGKGRRIGFGLCSGLKRRPMA